ncbi:MAG: hypothetical protein ABIR13_07855 [Polaromonas sp.]
MTIDKSFTSWHVGVAAEAIAAGLFARCGLDVSVQYGANQPEYDLLVARKNGKADEILKISVKGSKDDSWGLTQSFLSKRADKSIPPDYLKAADSWLATHSERTVLCLVQFYGTTLTQMPRVYLATAKEVANKLKATSKGRGDTILYERKVWTSRAFGAGTVDELPASWAFRKERVEELFTQLFQSQNTFHPLMQVVNAGS